MLELCDNSVMLRILGKNLEGEKRVGITLSYRSHSPSLFHPLEHVLNGNYGITIGQRVLLGLIGQFLIDHYDVLGQINSGPQQVVQTVDGAEHPINLFETNSSIKMESFRQRPGYLLLLLLLTRGK